MKTAWLVKVDYKVVKMKGFTSYESALNYYNQMIANIEAVLKGKDYEKQSTNLHSRPLITEFKQYDEECWLKFIKTHRELKRTDEVVLQYEKRINELEEQ